MKTRILVFGAVLTTLAGSFAVAGGWGRGGGAGRYEALGLSQEQTGKMEALGAECRREAEPLRKELFGKREELRKLWANPDLNAQAITAKQGELRALQEKMQAVRLQCETERRALLTPEQKARLAELRPGPGGGCGGPGARACRGPEGAGSGRGCGGPGAGGCRGPEGSEAGRGWRGGCGG